MWTDTVGRRKSCLCIGKCTLVQVGEADGARVLPSSCACMNLTCDALVKAGHLRAVGSKKLASGSHPSVDACAAAGVNLQLIGPDQQTGTYRRQEVATTGASAAERAMAAAVASTPPWRGRSMHTGRENTTHL